MAVQIRNDDMVELLKADFFGRNEAAMAWSNTVSGHLLLPALHCFWPCSAHHHTHANDYTTDIACGFDLTMTNTPLMQKFPSSLAPCIQFTSASSEYLTHADDPQFDILADDAEVLPAQRGLFMGGWFRWTVLAGMQGMMSKWVAVSNNRSYRLYKNAAHNIVFETSTLGTAATVTTVTSTGTVAVDTWYHVIGRMAPSVGLDVYIDGVRTTNAVAPPATIYHSNAAFTVAQTDGGSFMDGFTSLLFLSASINWDGAAVARDLYPFALYEYSKRLFNK